PAGLTTLIISAATRHFKSGARIDVNTVDWSTRSKVPSKKGSAAALAHSIRTEGGHKRRAFDRRSANKSIPVIFSGRAPHLTKSRSHSPVPQPTSRIVFDFKFS